MRADAMGALHPLVDGLRGTPAAAGAQDAHYAVVLRTGWEEDDVAVAASCSTSPTGHLQFDNGTVVIGTKGDWVISDPGYQQYMADSEREFTIGPAAHNCPVINGEPQDRKEPRLISLDTLGPDLLRTKLDLTACYPSKANVTSVMRSVWLSGRTGVVIADEIKADSQPALKYHWHGHPQVGWWAQDGWILLHLSDVALWFTSPQARLSGQNIQRLAGSRGQLTLVTEADAAAPVVWWAFALAGTPPPLTLLEGGRAVEFLGKRFQV